MKTINYILLLATLLYAAPSCAGIVSMEELYNPATGQTVILAGDVHTIVEKKPQQAEQLIAFAKKHNPFCLIEYSKLEEEAQKKEQATGKKLVNVPNLMGHFYDGCKQHNQLLSFEFRNASFRLMPYIMQEFFAPSQLSRLKGRFVEGYGFQGRNDNFFKQVGLLFEQAQKELKAELDGLEAFKKQLETEEPQARHTLVEIYENLLMQVKSKRVQLKNMPVKEQDESDVNYGVRAAEFLSEVFYSSNNGPNCWTLFMEIESHLLEANVVRHIFINKGKNKKIFVFTGAFHIPWISESLQKLGYVSKNSVSNTQALQKRQAELRSRSLQSRLNDTDLSQFTIDINAFLSQCTTLEAPQKRIIKPQEEPTQMSVVSTTTSQAQQVQNPAALTTGDIVKIGLGVGLAALGIYGFYKYCSKK